MKLKNLLFLFGLAIFFNSCNHRPSQTSCDTIGNPPADGFDLAHSDPAALELADSIMAAMGGRCNWDETRFISWHSFENRDLVWDKHRDRVRIQSHSDSTIYLINLTTLEGRVQIRGRELTEVDSLKRMLQRAKSIWLNDSYWLVMPFKLKDSGVTLKYLGEDTLMNGAKCNMLELTFEHVGDALNYKYQVYVDLSDNLVKQWAYFDNAEQDSASFIRPWDNYKKYGTILLSSDRSDSSGPRRVKVAESLSDNTFIEF